MEPIFPPTKRTESNLSASHPQMRGTFNPARLEPSADIRVEIDER
jgi:hypothetical protein